jgi:hypothetical protein
VKADNASPNLEFAPQLLDKTKAIMDILARTSEVNADKLSGKLTVEQRQEVRFASRLHALFYKPFIDNDDSRKLLVSNMVKEMQELLFRHQVGMADPNRLAELET